MILMNFRLKTTKHPNSYTLSKALAEEVVYSFHKKLPIVIIRPSKVWYAIKEPFEGFIEGMNSGIGLLCGMMTGVVRTMYVVKKNPINLTPVDYLANATIVSCWKRSTVKNDDNLLIYNCSDSPENLLTWEKSKAYAEPYFVTYAPYKNALWNPTVNYTSNFLWHKISLYLLQLLPAIFFDSVQVLSGRKAK